MKNTHVFWFLLVTGFLLFKPAPGMILGSNSVIGFTLLVLVFSAVIFLLTNKSFITQHPISNITNEIKTDRIMLYFLLVCLSFVISTVTGLIVVPDKTGLGDFLELYRYPLYIILYLLAKRLSLTNIQQIAKPVFIMFIAIELFGVLQFLNIFNINETLGMLYTMSERHYHMIVYQQRIPGTLLNPNMYGSFLIIVIALLLGYLTYGKTNKKISTFVYIGIFLTLVSVILTTSRTAVITLGGVIVYWILLNIVTNRKKLKRTILQGIAVLAVYLLAAVILIPHINYLNYAATQLYNTYTAEEAPKENNEVPNEDPDADFDENATPDDSNSINSAKKSLESVSSFKNRYDYWQLNFEEFLESPIVGHGPMRGNFVSFADNTYLYILARYGIVGLLILAGFIFYTYFYTAKSIWKRQNQSTLFLATAVNLVIVGYIVMGMVSEVWYNLQSMAFLFILLGLLFNKNLNKQEDL